MVLDQGICVCMSAPNSIMKIDVCVPLSTMETPYFCVFLKLIAIILELEYIIYNLYVKRWVYLTSLHGKTWQNKNSEVYCF